MSIWKRPIDIDALNRVSEGTASDMLGMRVTEVGDDYIRGELEVSRRAQQPKGRLHGGVSCVLAETLGSLGGILSCDDGFAVVGVDINATHLSGVSGGRVIGTARPLRIGRRMQFWTIEITAENGKPVCSARLSLAVVPASADDGGRHCG